MRTNFSMVSPEPSRTTLIFLSFYDYRNDSNCPK